MKSSSHIKISISENVDQLSAAAADFIDQKITEKPGLLLCAATGNSPTVMYRHLAEKAQHNSHRYAKLRVIKLDEWGGLDMANPATCEYYIQQHVIKPLNITADRYTAFQSNPPDVTAECERINNWLDEHGPIDLCILGLGANGHLALNEPSDFLITQSHAVTLTEQSKQHAMLNAAGQPVDFGLTLGIGQIMAARSIVFIVNGQHKKNLLQQFFEPRVSTHFPASILKLHPDVHCFFDREATS